MTDPERIFLSPLLAGFTDDDRVAFFDELPSGTEYRRADIADAETTRLFDENAGLRAENERLRHALALCRTELFSAASYRGYEGGPLDSPSVDVALRLGEAALKGARGE